MRIGISSVGFGLTEENFKKLSENQIDAIEVSMATDKHKDIDCKKLQKLSESYGVMLWSYHLPFRPFEELVPDVSALDG